MYGITNNEDKIFCITREAMELTTRYELTGEPFYKVVAIDAMRDMIDNK